MIVNESPDFGLSNDKKRLNYDTPGAYSFGYYDDKMYVSNALRTHGELFTDNHIEDSELYQPGRSTLQFAGRLWTEQKIISFWDYPDKKEYPKVLRDIQQAFYQSHNLKINFLDGKWYIDIPNKDRNSKLTTYLWMRPRKLKWPKEEKEKEHELSPLLKRDTTVPDGVGSKKYQSEKPLPFRQAMYAESYFPRLDEMDFERGQDPKTVLGIGMGEIIKPYSLARYDLEDSYPILTKIFDTTANKIYMIGDKSDKPAYINKIEKIIKNGELITSKSEPDNLVYQTEVGVIVHTKRHMYNSYWGNLHTAVHLDLANEV